MNFDLVWHHMSRFGCWLTFFWVTASPHSGTRDVPSASSFPAFFPFSFPLSGNMLYWEIAVIWASNIILCLNHPIPTSLHCSWMWVAALRPVWEAQLILIDASQTVLSMPSIEIHNVQFVRKNTRPYLQWFLVIEQVLVLSFQILWGPSSQRSQKIQWPWQAGK